MAQHSEVDGTLVIHEVATRAAERHAQVQAGIVADALDQMGFAGATFSPGFMLHLGALAQLKLWELTGVHELLADLPTFAEAAADLHAQVQQDSLQFRAADSALARLVFQTWCDRLGWDAPSILDADVVVGAIDEDDLVDALAELLWAHRHHRIDENQQSKAR